MNRNIKYLLIILILLMQISVNAEYKEPIKYLVNEPVSLFSLGMHQLNDYIRSITKEYKDSMIKSDIYFAGNKKNIKIEDFMSRVSYNERDNKIEIIFDLVLNREITKEEGKELCSSITKYIKLKLNVPKNETAENPLIHSDLGYFFSDPYSQKKAPFNIAKEIDKISEIIVGISEIGKGINKEIISSKSSLIDRKIIYSER
jgi:hypothetical protein